MYEQFTTLLSAGHDTTAFFGCYMAYLLESCQQWFQLEYVQRVQVPNASCAEVILAFRRREPNHAKLLNPVSQLMGKSLNVPDNYDLLESKPKPKQVLKLFENALDKDDEYVAMKTRLTEHSLKIVKVVSEDQDRHYNPIPCHNCK